MRVHKQSKFTYYLKGFGRLLSSKEHALEKTIFRLEKEIGEEKLHQVHQRVEYYNQLKNNELFALKNNTTINDLRHPSTPKAYYFDTYEYARFFNKSLLIDVEFGDVTHIPDTPAIVKSRPISHHNQNSVLMKLDKVRHFVFVDDTIDFSHKKDRLIGRCAIYQPHRIDFYQKYFHHSLCDLGQVNTNGGNTDWLKPKMSLPEHLHYKFILSLQGNDVATNLKWIMSSNSIAVMPKPTIETWFMEGTLVGGKHYIELLPDYSDLEEKLTYYILHRQECLQIIRNANAYCAQFRDRNVEDLCSLLVLKKYLSLVR